MHLPARIETRPFSGSPLQTFRCCHFILLLTALATSPLPLRRLRPRRNSWWCWTRPTAATTLGARLGNQAEKDYTLALSVKLRSLLMARGMAVVTTRESGADVDADHRAEIANRANAAACLSLHAALVTSKSGPAVHLFISSLPPAAGRALCAVEDRAVCVDHAQHSAGRGVEFGAHPCRHHGDSRPHRAARDRQHGLPCRRR